VSFQGVTIDLAGRSGPVQVQIRDMPVVARMDGPGYRYPTPEFGSEFLEAVVDGMPTADRAGWPWRRVTRCGVCQSLVSSPIPEAEFAIPIRLTELPEFRVEFRLPAIKCEQCGLEQMLADNTISFHRTEALSQAFKAAQVEPD
jgi:hypothetical protein